MKVELVKKCRKYGLSSMGYKIVTTEWLDEMQNEVLKELECDSSFMVSGIFGKLRASLNSQEQTKEGKQV